MKKNLLIKLFILDAVVALAIVTLIWRFLTRAPQASDKTSQPSAAAYDASRIVSMAPNLTELLFALGLEKQIIAVTSDSNFPQQALSLPKVGTFWQPNTEAIIAVKPDLVVCETFAQQKEVAETLKRAGLRVVSLRVESIEELFNAITQIGSATGCSDKAEQLAEKIKSELNQIRAKASSAKKVKVLWAVQTEPMRVVGVKTFVNEIIDLAGGQNIIAPTGDQYPSVGTETILTCGAEVIIQSAMGTEDITKQQKTAEKFWSRFANLPAAKGKRIYVIDPDTVLRLGPRLPQGAQAVAKCLHPELFAPPQETKQTNE